MNKTQLYEMNIKGALMELSVLRETKIKNAEIYGQKMAEFNTSNLELLSSIDKVKEQTESMESIIRTNAVDHYHINKDKSVCQGVKIKIMKDFQFDDAEALKWAEKSGIGLSLNKKVFESFAKSQENDLNAAKLDFVTIDEIPSATIPTKIEVD